jgi:hypothetical protein
MFRTLLLTTAMCAALTTPTAAHACTDEMARLAQAASSPTVSADLKDRVRAVLVQAREQQSAGHFLRCSRTLAAARRLLNLPNEAQDMEPLRIYMRS